MDAILYVRISIREDNIMMNICLFFINWLISLESASGRDIVRSNFDQGGLYYDEYLCLFYELVNLIRELKLTRACTFEFRSGRTIL